MKYLFLFLLFLSAPAMANPISFERSNKVNDRTIVFRAKSQSLYCPETATMSTAAKKITDLSKSVITAETSGRETVFNFRSPDKTIRVFASGCVLMDE